MSHRRRLVLPLFIALVLAAFGAQAEERLRIVMVTHGAAGDPFWTTIREGAERAAAEAGVALDYRAPETFDVAAMAGLVEAAIAEKPGGLIVSIPSAEALKAPLQAASEAGVPVISMNSGFDSARALGALLHVGQSEYDAGRIAGEAMRAGGGKKALCLNHEPGNSALDLRCKGFIDGFGGSVEVMAIPAAPEETRREIDGKLAADPEIDAVLALNASLGGEPAVAAAAALGSARTVGVGSFDVNEPMLKAVAEGRAAFVIDQQALLQGYLPVHLLALYLRDGVVPTANIATGPKLVTAEEAKRRLEAAEPGGG